MTPALFEVDFRRPLLVARFSAPQRMLSWSISRPGFVTAHAVAMLEVRDGDLAPDVDPRALLADRLAAEGLQEAVGLMTSRDIARHHRATRRVDGVGAGALVTLGLNNGERVGMRVPSRLPERVGTVNILAALSVPLTNAALAEALSIAVEARTVAILEAGYHREGQDAPVTGTGTDCVVVSAPAAVPGTAPHEYAGLHTAAGEALGAAVLSATREAAAQWIRDQSAS
ncbi:adenosylcobinamide amidohydrolase [Xanthobacter pseudotagetidis]|uniref:adenosylcobinamide amidohydrolase n=1 Tax=Xanthobacter pseudotagetidis TaxID=3119911 RepID=UPI0037273A73